MKIFLGISVPIDPANEMQMAGVRCLKIGNPLTDP